MKKNLLFSISLLSLCLLPSGFSAEQKLTFLGVSTAHVAPSVREYLEMEDGFGIQVHEVVKDSPAAKAGLKRSDVLVRFNDQDLISPEHLSLLVKRESAGDTISLTVIRKGIEESLKIELGDAPRSSLMQGPRSDPRSSEQWQEHMKQQQDYWQRRMNQPKPGNKAPDTPGKPPAVSVNPGFPVRVFGSEGVIKIDNEKGEVSITREGEVHEIVIKDAAGTEIFSGPYDSDKGIAGLPKAAQEHLKLMKLDNLEILAPRAAADEPEKTSAPMQAASPADPEDLL
ncbi:MAG: PDZ domain-containing protein [Verrucomicrobiales bacterium]|nr:PDZ domain-containing protein [Verrucomicrobiales bacterium]